MTGNEKRPAGYSSLTLTESADVLTFRDRGKALRERAGAVELLKRTVCDQLWQVSHFQC